MTYPAAQLRKVSGAAGFASRSGSFRTLSEDRDYWRNRARDAEGAMRGDAWHQRLYPYTLAETRILRLLAKHEVASKELILHALYSGHSGVPGDIHTIRTLIVRIRRKMPKDLGVSIDHVWGVGYHVKNRDVVSDYLSSLKPYQQAKRAEK